MALEMPLDADSYCTYLGAEEGTMLLLWGYTTGQPLWVILCRLQEKGRKETVEEKKERDREARETGMKVKKTEEIKTFPLYPYMYM